MDSFGRMTGHKTAADKEMQEFKRNYSNKPIKEVESMQGVSSSVKKTTRKFYQSVFGGAAYEDPNGWHSHVKGGFGHERDNTYKSNKQQNNEDGGYRWETMPDDDETTLAGGAVVEFTNQWILANIRVPPQIEFRSVVDGDMDRKKHNFECILTVPGFPHASRKKAGGKAEARLMACVDFIQYLVNNNHLDQDSLPEFFDTKFVEGKDMPGKRDMAKAASTSNKFLDKPQIEQRKVEREKKRQERNVQAKRTQSYGWDKRSARFRLHKFCRENNIQADIKVVAHGSEYSVINEATIKFRYDGKTYETSTKNRNKKWAQNDASLQVVNQLCADGHIEKCENARKWHQLQEGSEKRMWEKKDHGGWSLESARPRIYKYLKEQKIYDGMIFTVFGNPPVERHIAEIKFAVRAKGPEDDEAVLMEVNGRAEGPNKDLAERRCALHTIMQLHKLGLVNKDKEDKEAEKQLALGSVEITKLGVDGASVRQKRRNQDFKMSDSRFFKAAPSTAVKRQKQTDLFTASFEAMKDQARAQALAMQQLHEQDNEKSVAEAMAEVGEDVMPEASAANLVGDYDDSDEETEEQIAEKAIAGNVQHIGIEAAELKAIEEKNDPSNFETNDLAAELAGHDEEAAYLQVEPNDANDILAINGHANMLAPDEHFENFKQETLADLDSAFKDLQKRDANLMSFNDVDISAFGLSVKDEYVAQRVMATQKRPTRDLLEKYTTEFPAALNKKLKKYQHKGWCISEMAVKECAIRMNIMRCRHQESHDQVVFEEKETEELEKAYESQTADQQQAKAAVHVEQKVNGDDYFVLYLEIVLTSPDCSQRMLEQHGIDSQAPSGVGPAVSRFAVLPLLPSLEANRHLRRKTWWMNEVNKDKRLCRDFSKICIVMRDLAYRWPNWQPLGTWHIIMLIYTAMKSHRWQIHDYRNHVMYSDIKKRFTPADNFRRMMELISNGFCLSTGPGLIDPCETGDMDVFADMTLEMRNSITHAAQLCLRSMNAGKLQWYLSDPDAANGPNQAQFGYGTGMESIESGVMNTNAAPELGGAGGLGENGEEMLEIDGRLVPQSAIGGGFDPNSLVPRHVQAAQSAQVGPQVGHVDMPEDIENNTGKEQVEKVGKDMQNKLDSFMAMLDD